MCQTARACVFGWKKGLVGCRVPSNICFQLTLFQNLVKNSHEWKCRMYFESSFGYNYANTIHAIGWDLSPPPRRYKGLRFASLICYKSKWKGTVVSNVKHSLSHPALKNNANCNCWDATYSHTCHIIWLVIVAQVVGDGLMPLIFK